MKRYWHRHFLILHVIRKWKWTQNLHLYTTLQCLSGQIPNSPGQGKGCKIGSKKICESSDLDRTRDDWHRDYLDYLTSITGRAGLVRSASPSWQWARWPGPDWGSGRRVKVLIITSAPATLSHRMSGGNFLTYPVAAALDLLCPRSHWNYITLVFLILFLSRREQTRCVQPTSCHHCPWRQPSAPGLHSCKQFQTQPLAQQYNQDWE